MNMKNNKKNKGFTLIELIIVITIVGILSVITIPIITSNSKKAKTKYYTSLKEDLVTMAKQYYIDNIEELPRNQITETKLSVKDLEIKNYVTNDVVDTEGNSCEEQSYISVVKEEEKYLYKVCLICDGVSYTEDICDSNGEEIPGGNVNVGEFVCQFKGPFSSADNSTAKETFKNGEKAYYSLICSSENGMNSNIKPNIKVDSTTNNIESTLINTTEYKNGNKKGYSYSYELGIKTGNGTAKLVLEAENNKDFIDNKSNYLKTNVVSNQLKISNSKPVCKWTGPFTNQALTTIASYGKKESTIYYALNCTDTGDTIVKNATASDITISNQNLLNSIKLVKTNNITNGKQYIFSLIIGTDTGTVTLTAKDNIVTNSSGSGNVSVTSTSLGVDNKAPTCGTVSGASTSWTNSPRTISQQCNDTGGSGCVKTSYSTTYSSSIATDTITISDKAGNTNSCSYNVFIDTSAPHGCSCWMYYGDGVDCACYDWGSGFGRGGQQYAGNYTYICHHVDRYDDSGDWSGGHDCSPNNQGGHLLYLSRCRTVTVDIYDAIGNRTYYTIWLCPS